MKMRLESMGGKMSEVRTGEKEKGEMLPFDFDNLLATPTIFAFAFKVVV